MRRAKPHLKWGLVLGGSVLFSFFPFFISYLFYNFGVSIYMNIFLSILLSLLFIVLVLIHVYLNFLWCKNVDLYFYKENEVGKNKPDTLKPKYGY